jgi:hypothetical protein
MGGVAAPSCVSLGFAYGVDPARTAVVASPPRRGVFLGSANSGHPAKTAVVLTPPRCVISLAFANRVCPERTAVVLAPPLLAYGCCGWACSRVCTQRRQRWGSRRVAFASRDGPGIRGGRRPSEDGGGVLVASFWDFPLVRKPRVSSEDGGGAHTASAGLWLLWLGLFEGVQAATAVVVISLPRALLLVASGW